MSNFDWSNLNDVEDEPQSGAQPSRVAAILQSLGTSLPRAAAGMRAMTFQPSYGSNLTDLGRNVVAGQEVGNNFLLGGDRNQLLRERNQLEDDQSKRRENIDKMTLDFRRDTEKAHANLLGEKVKLDQKIFDASQDLNERDKKLGAEKMKIMGLNTLNNLLVNTKNPAEKMAFNAKVIESLYAARGAVELANQLLSGGKTKPEIVEAVRDLNLTKFNPATGQYEVNESVIPSVKDYNQLFGDDERSKQQVGALFSSGIFGEEMKQLGSQLLGPTVAVTPTAAAADQVPVNPLFSGAPSETNQPIVAAPEDSGFSWKSTLPYAAAGPMWPMVAAAKAARNYLFPSPQTNAPSRFQISVVP